MISPPLSPSYIISGSEDKNIYVFNTDPASATLLQISAGMVKNAANGVIGIASSSSSAAVAAFSAASSTVATPLSGGSGGGSGITSVNASSSAAAAAAVAAASTSSTAASSSSFTLSMFEKFQGVEESGSVITCALFAPLSTRNFVEYGRARMGLPSIRSMNGSALISAPTSTSTTTASHSRFGAGGFIHKMMTGHSSSSSSSTATSADHGWTSRSDLDEAIIIATDSLGRIRVYENQIVAQQTLAAHGMLSSSSSSISSHTASSISGEDSSTLAAAIAAARSAKSAPLQQFGKCAQAMERERKREMER